MSEQEFTIPDAKPVSSVELPMLDVQNVLKKAEGILSAYKTDSIDQVIQPDQVGETIDNKFNSTPRIPRPPLPNLIQQYLSARSRTISNSSNIFDDNDSVALKTYGANVSELDHLREENEHLSIKLNRLRYDLKSRDSTVDDLKLKITQMYVELEASNMTKRKLESDLEAIKRDFNLHSSLESARLKEQIASVSAEKDALLQRLQPLEMSYAQQIQMIDRLRLEKDELARQAQETNAKLSRERDELSKRLESFEADIVQRERYAFGQKFEKMLFENSEEIRAEETRKFQQLLLAEKGRYDAEKERYENEIKVLKSQQTSQQATFESQLNINRNELISSLAKEVETKFNVLNQERDALYQNEKKALEDKINELNAEIGGLVKSLVDEKQKLTDKTNELTEANKQILKVKADLKKVVSSKPSSESRKVDTSDIEWIGIESNYEDKYKAASVDLENLNREIALLREENAKFKESSTTIVSTGENGVQDESLIRDLNDKILEAQTLSQTLASNLGEWNKSNESIESLILEQQELHAQYTANFSEWTSANEVLTQNIQIAQGEKIELETELEKAQVDLEEIKKRKTTLEDELTAIRVRSSELEADVLSTQQLNGELAKNLSDWTLANQQIENSILELQAVNQSLMVNLAELNQSQSSEAKQQDGDGDRPEAQAAEKQAEHMKTLKQQIDQLNTQNEHLKTENFRLADQIDAVRLEKDKLEQDFNSLDTVVITLKNDVDGLEQLKSQLNEQIERHVVAEEEMRSRYEELAKQHQMLVDSRSDLKSKIAELDEELKKAVSDRDKAVEEVKAHSLDMSHELAMIEEEKLKNQLDEHKAQIGRLEQLRQELQVQNMDLLGEVDTLKIENEDLVMNCELAKKELDDFKTLVEQQEEERRSTQAAETESAAQDLERTIEELRLANSKKVELIETLNEEISGLKAARSELESQVEELNNKLSSIESLNSQLDARKEENEELKMTTGRLNRELSELKSQLDLNSSVLSSTIEELSNIGSYLLKVGSDDTFQILS